MAVDERYNLYVAGNFEGNVPFDPAPSKVVLESQGDDDAFAAHFSNSGRLLWAKSFGGSRDDSATSIALDGKNQIYVAGVFEGEVDLDPDYTDFEAKSQGGTDVFVVVLQVGGRLLTATHFGGSGDEDRRACWWSRTVRSMSPENSKRLSTLTAIRKAASSPAGVKAICSCCAIARAIILTGSWALGAGAAKRLAVWQKTSGVTSIS